jgi:hypothetical protein
MTAKTRADGRDGTAEMKLYLPGGITPPVETGRLERLRGRLFTHGAGPPE